MLLVRIKHGVAVVGNSREVPQKIKSRATK